MIGTWNLNPGETKEFLFNIPARMLKGLKGLSLECLKGDGDVECNGYILEADGHIISSYNGNVLTENGILHLNLDIHSNVNANNGCVLKLKLKSSACKISGILQACT